MSQFNLDKTWAYCLKMWADIAEQAKDGLIDVHAAKRQWVREYLPDISLENDCFFCDYANSWCTFCPARQIDKLFSCVHSCYDYEYQPLKFYEKIKELNEIRLKGKQMDEKEIKQRIEQGKKDRASIDANIVELENKLKQLEKPKWIAAIAEDKRRLILNVSALSQLVKRSITDPTLVWISIDINGDRTMYRNQYDEKLDDGLVYYDNTTIIFGEKK